MRHRFSLLSLVFFFVLCFPLFAAGNYKNGNGTVISVTRKKHTVSTLRKCSYSLTVGEKVSAEVLMVHKRPDSPKVIGMLKPFDEIQILEVLEQKKPAPYYWDEYFEQDIWFHITKGKLNGWIKVANCLSSAYEINYFNPYDNDRWSVLEIITKGQEDLTVRKYEQDLFVNGKVPVYKNPWQAEEEIINIIDASEIKQSVLVQKVVEEPATIEGTTDYWLYVSYKKLEGWIFGGQILSPPVKEKYHFPQMIIAELLDGRDVVEM